MKILQFYKAVWGALGNFKKKYIFLFFILLLTAFAEGVNIGFLLPLFSFILDSNSISDNALLARLNAYVSKENLLILLLLILLGLIVLKNGLKIFSSYLTPTLVWDVRNLWTTKIISKYLYLPYHKIINYKQGYLVNNAIEEPLRATKMLSSLMQATSSFLSLLAIYLVLLFCNWVITFIITVIMGLIVYLLKKKLTKISVESGNLRVVYQQKLHGYLSEVISGFKEVKVFQVEERVKSYITDILNSYGRISVVFGLGRALPMPIIETLLILVVVISCIILVLKYGINSFSLYLPIASVFILGTMKMFTYVSIFSTQLMNVLNLNPSFMKVASLIEFNDGVVGKKKNNPTGGEINLVSRIKLENVSFSYGDKTILQNLNLTIKAGETTFIVGKSGKGKTTIMYLLLGLIKPDEGDYYMDDTLIDDHTRESILNIASYVSQDNYLFHDSIKNNIFFASGDDRFDPDYRMICNITKVNSFVENLANGYDTIVGDRGEKFSEGQKQRIALARALAKKAQIYIFDEPTSNLDKHTSNVLIDILNYLKEKKKTIIVITHKEKDLSLADNIIEI